MQVGLREHNKENESYYLGAERPLFLKRYFYGVALS